MVGPVFTVEGHFILLDYKQVKVADAFHGVVEVQEAVLVAPARWSEDRTLDCVQILLEQETVRQPHVTHHMDFGKVLFLLEFSFTDHWNT